MNLFIIRHGETVENARGIIQGHSQGSLSPKGIQETIELARRIKPIATIDQIISSDLRRAIDTAALIMNELGQIGVSTDKRLRERGFGILEGESIKTLKRKLLEQSCGLNQVFIEGAESHNEFSSRIKEFIQGLIVLQDDRNKILVTHAGVLQVIWDNYLKLDSDQTIFRNNSGFVLSLNGEILTLNHLLP